MGRLFNQLILAWATHASNDTPISEGVLGETPPKLTCGGDRGDQAPEKNFPK
jgi:hypothetical protein